VFLAGWPEVGTIHEELIEDMSAVRRVVELGRQAHAAAGLKLREPLRRLMIEGADRIARHADLVADELRVKDAVVGHVSAALRVRPNLPRLGPRLGAELPKVRRALIAGELDLLQDGAVVVAGHRLEPDDVLAERAELAGWEIISDDGVTVALDVILDEDRRVEGPVYDLVHRADTLRKDAGLEVTDRIPLILPAGDADLLARREWIMTGTLAAELDVGTDADVHVERVS
jgi:isoleucyl-tRNA synthetase